MENEREHYWEVFARCVNPDCRYMRRYLPDTTYTVQDLTPYLGACEDANFLRDGWTTCGGAKKIIVYYIIEEQSATSVDAFRRIG